MKAFLKSRLARLGKDESGAGMIEYALLAALISVAAIVTMTAVGTEVNTTFNKVDTKLSAANAANP